MNCSIDFNDLIAKPFEYGGRGPDKYDCFGLVLEAYRRFGIAIPDYSISSYACEIISNKIDSEKSNSCWYELSAPEVPCVVLIKAHFYFTQHFGVYIGFGKFLHIQDYGVCISRINTPIWNKRIKGYYQYVPQNNFSS